MIFNTVIFRIDATMLSLLKGGEAVGLYGAAYRALESTLFLVYAFTTASLPTLSRLRRHTAPSVGAVYETGLKAITTVMLPVGATFLLFGGPILELLYGTEFGPATASLHWLGGAAALYGLSYFSGVLLLGQDRTRILAAVTGCVMIENIALNLVVIPRFSYTGAAAATTITEATTAVALVFCARRAVGRLSGRRVLLAPLAGVAAMALVHLALGASIPVIAVALMAYAAVIAATERLAFPDDFSRATSALRRRLRPAT